MTDSNIKGSFAALKRASLRAREIAKQTGTPLYIMLDGKVQAVSPDTLKPIPTEKIPTKFK